LVSASVWFSVWRFSCPPLALSHTTNRTGLGWYGLMKIWFRQIFPRKKSDVARLDCQWCYWIVVKVLTVQYRHTRLWRFSQKRRYITGGQLLRLDFCLNIFINEPLWRFSNTIWGSCIKKFL
jgi:hypothetical protein